MTDAKGKEPSVVVGRFPYYTPFINGRLAIFENLNCPELKKELNNRKDSVKMSHCVYFRVIVSFDEK